MSLPRAIDATKLADSRIQEILTVCDQIKSSDSERYGLEGLPRCLRRRTRSHNSYRHGKRPNRTKKARTDEEVSVAAFTNRRMRRRETFRRYVDPWGDDANDMASYRLPTHVFHAKRLQMTKMDGSKFIVPLGARGRGRGTRSFHHKLNTTCVVHDASYWCSIELEGPNEDIKSFLRDISGGHLQDIVSHTSEHRIDGYRLGSTKARMGPLDILCIKGNSTSWILIWAHCIYSDTLVGDVRDPLGAYGHLLRSVGRLGRIEQRGPRSKEILRRLGQGCQRATDNLQKIFPESRVIWIQNGSSKCLSELETERDDILSSLMCSLVSAINGTRSQIDLICIKKDDGYSIITSRDAYDVLFKGICLSGSHIAGQREWHWYHTISKQLFYPNDYQDSLVYHQLVSDLANQGFLQEFSANGRSAADFVPAFVWVIKNGTLRAGDILCNIEDNETIFGSRKIVIGRELVTGSYVMTERPVRPSHVGIITSAKPYALHSKYCSVAILDCSRFPSAGKDLTKMRLWSYSPSRGLLVPVTVRLAHI